MEGLRLALSNSNSVLTNHEEINTALAPYGSHIWPLDLRGVPDHIREFLRKHPLTPEESQRVQSQFLLSRDRLLDTVSAAGRAPQVDGGGELSTADLTHEVKYPQLYVVVPEIDYTRFDRFHVNTADDGTGVDEVMQVLSGEGVRILQHLPAGQSLELQIDCVGQDYAWLITYDGGYPHIGSISGAQIGTKVLMQIIGPPEWQMRYEDSV